MGIADTTNSQRGHALATASDGGRYRCDAPSSLTSGGVLDWGTPVGVARFLGGYVMG